MDARWERSTVTALETRPEAMNASEHLRTRACRSMSSGTSGSAASSRHASRNCMAASWGPPTAKAWLPASMLATAAVSRSPARRACRASSAAVPATRPDCSAVEKAVCRRERSPGSRSS